MLAFEDLSPEGDQGYFAEGISEELLNLLAREPGLKVLGRTSSFAFKGQNRGVAEIAETLGVAHVLEGSVQKAGNQVRVTAQLIRAEDGFHVWSQNYTRPLEDVFAIQEEISMAVARELSVALGLGALASRDGGKVTVIATGFHTMPEGAQLPATKATPRPEAQNEESTPTRASRFLVPGGPNSEYGINQTDDYEIPAILRKQRD